MHMTYIRVTCKSNYIISDTTRKVIERAKYLMKRKYATLHLISKELRERAHDFSIEQRYFDISKIFFAFEIPHFSTIIVKRFTIYLFFS